MSSTFTSIDKKHSIGIKILGDVAEFEIIQFQYENYKTFLLLLKTVVEHFASNSIKFIKQRIAEDELPLFHYSTLDVWYKEDEIALITTPIEYFAEEIYNVLGLCKL